eukprot:TRINITY_DN10672_c0_g1_i1.p1 TRINITY_DN10672_c0_g1~~TRINITY_DN10672_c0_g1_i1.p1  ORF type:complete len:217 (+),score=45.30 TRINITY_DN10672_c0_g1_i1:51-653(+)
MAGIMNFVYWIGAIFVIRSIDFTDETNVWMLRCLFVVVQGLVWLVMGFIGVRATLRSNMTLVTVFDTPMFHVDNGEEQPKVNMTVKQYHLNQLQAMMYKIGLTTLIVCGIHYKWEIMPPLLMQCFLNPSQVFSSPLFKIYILGESELNHAIPWEVQKPFPTDLSEQFQPEARHKKKIKEKALTQLREQNRKAIKSAKKES